MLKKIVYLTALFYFSSQPITFSNPLNSPKINTLSAVDRPVVKADESTRVVVKVGLVSEDGSEPVERMPLNLAIVIDKSGSMGSQDKIENAKSGAIEMIQRLNKADYVALVVYDDTARTLYPAQPLKDKEELIGIIQAIESSGSTAMYAGILSGSAEVAKNKSSDYLNRIILLSDGLANVGPQSPEDFSQLGNSIAGSGVNISAVGVGLDFNEDTLLQLAIHSDGNYYYAKNGDELPEIFKQEIGRATALIAQNIEIELECLSGASPHSTLGPRSTVAGGTFRTRIPYMYGLEERSELYEIAIPERKNGEVLKVASAKIRYDDPLSKERIEREVDIEVVYSNSDKEIASAQDLELTKAVALKRTAEAQYEAIKLSDSGDYLQAAQTLINNSAKLEEIARLCNNDQDLHRKAREQRALSDDIISNRQMTNYQRKGEVMNMQFEFWGN